METVKIQEMLGLAGDACHFQNIVRTLEDKLFESNGPILKVWGYDPCSEDYPQFEFNAIRLNKGLSLLKKPAFKTSFQRWLLWAAIK